jgi:sn-glycerol 3-phosphate transport system ATP-binding protein
VAEIIFEDVTKEFPGGTIAVDHLSIAAEDGEFLIFVGPSGCGKTTALRLIAGLEKPTSGLIAVGDQIVNELSPHERDIAMVFQNYALYPHMTVYKNLAFGLKMRKLSKSEIDQRVRQTSTMLGLEDLLKRKPGQLSGGQRQRVAMGRALVREPEAFLLDEPLSNLDAKLRVQVRADLKQLHQRLGVTTIYVTHDQVEAMTLGDRIAVMSNGKLQQLGPPQDVYSKPQNAFVAAFIGSPAMNMLRGVARGGQVTAGSLSVPVPNVPDGDVILGVRPEAFRTSSDHLPSLEMEVQIVEPLGDEAIVHGAVDGQLAEVETGDEETELLPPLPTSRAVITARFDPEDTPSPGTRVRLAVPPDRVHIFDARTGAAIT